MATFTQTPDTMTTYAADALAEQPAYEEEIHRDHDAEVEVESDDEEETLENPNAPIKFNFSWRKLWRFAGPGWLMSLAYLDPGNLESDLQQGAYSGYRLVWVLWWATVMGLVLQEMAARIGIVTGRDLAQTVRSGYPRWLTYFIYINMEIAVIASDIQEVVGTGVAIYLFTNKYVPVWVGCIITATDTFTFLAIQYLGVRYLEAFICILISTMSIAFFINWGVSGGSSAGSDLDQNLPFGWAVPSVQSWAVTQAVGTIGAVIMPHNLYLHSGLVLSRKISRNKPSRVNDAIQYARMESAGALLMSFFINLAVVAVNADQFYTPTCAQLADGPYACMSYDAFQASGQDNDTDSVPVPCKLPRGNGEIGYCGDFGLESEGDALSSALGAYTLYFWAIGLFAAGQAATMVCTYAGQIIMGGCLQIQLAPWVRVAITRVFALGPALAVAVSTYNDQKLFNMLNEYLNVLQSVQLPFAMLPVLHFAAQANLMGRFKSGAILTFVSSSLAVAVMGFNIVLIVQFIQDPDMGFTPGAVVAVCCYGVVYFGVCVRMIWTELKAVSYFAVGFVSGCRAGLAGRKIGQAEGLTEGLTH